MERLCEASPLRPLLGLSPDELSDVAMAAGLPRYAGRQLAGWIYRRGARSLAEMTDLPKEGRRRLSESAAVGRMEPLERHVSVDGTVKYLFPTAAGHYVETVFIPDGERATLCVSSQVGCKMGCAFCMTGRQGFVANLTAADILNQIFSLPERERLTNIVFMGQGEPLDNWESVRRATQVLTASWGLAWSPKRITISTVGLRRNFRRLLDECDCHVAVSLHHPLPEGRAALMLAERAWPVSELLNVLRGYDFCRRAPRATGKPKQRRLSFEYIVFRGVNDTLRHADALVSLLRGLDCRVNLIRFHAIPDSPLCGVPESRMLRLRDYLTAHGVFTTVRASRGEDIMAACGLLSTARAEAAARAAGVPQPAAESGEGEN